MHACRYDVYWQESRIEWSSRWEAYLDVPNGRVHWITIINSLVVLLVMNVILVRVLLRAVRRDMEGYEELPGEDQVPLLR
jgi:transmembrane 9 superfamily member 2/4